LLLPPPPPRALTLPEWLLRLRGLPAWLLRYLSAASLSFRFRLVWRLPLLALPALLPPPASIPLPRG
jgi:hypothetical protein